MNNNNGDNDLIAKIIIFSVGIIILALLIWVLPDDFNKECQEMCDANRVVKCVGKIYDNEKTGTIFMTICATPPNDQIAIDAGINDSSRYKLLVKKIDKK